VTDRSANKVARTGRYVFDQPVMLVKTTAISMHFWIEGADGGSIVKPFIGIFDAAAQPQWRYEPVPGFNGLFVRQFASPDFIDGFTVSISYAANAPFHPGPSMSRLVYSVSGSYVTFAQRPIAPWNITGDSSGFDA
ncbi:MAG TPA: hypothetical protein VF698_04215, partial [Thermoanaerobaculia bacterium]